MRKELKSYCFPTTLFLLFAEKERMEQTLSELDLPDLRASLPQDEEPVEVVRTIENDGHKYTIHLNVQRLPDENLQVGHENLPASHEESPPEPPPEEVPPPETHRTPKLERVEVSIDPNDSRKKCYVYRKKYTVNTKDGVKERTQLLRREYTLKSPAESPRESLCKQIIAELKRENADKQLSVHQYWKLYQEKALKERQNMPFSYPAFATRFSAV